MSYRKINLPAFFNKNTAVGLRRKIDPAVLEPAAVVIGQSDGTLFPALVIARKYPGLDKDLKTVAYPENKLAIIYKSPYGIGKMMYDLVRKYPARSYIITIAEPARKNNYMELAEKALVFNDPVYMDPLHLRACQMQSMFGFQVAVYPCRPQNYRFYFH
jgi:hypothetical protein